MTDPVLVFPRLTAIAAALLALWLVALSGAVMARRMGRDILHGDDGDPVLRHRIRAQGNFVEYVPLALLMVGLLGWSGGDRTLVAVLLVMLVAGRVLHPFGMGAAKNSPRQFACRGLGILLTLLSLVVAAVALLVRVS
ncbi:MAG: MAPEG family protein [Gluconacetobacter diazotrophicus]|nr:MAPEG family protein [Gluconacetobacter diazotrophicus]